MRIDDEHSFGFNSSGKDYNWRRDFDETDYQTAV
jgi:hypothetical protein